MTGNRGHSDFPTVQPVDRRIFVAGPSVHQTTTTMTSQFAASLLRQSFLRQSLRLQQRRFASTESAQKKATEALSDAGKTAEKVLEGAKKFLGPVGEKAGNLLGCAPLSPISDAFWH